MTSGAPDRRTTKPNGSTPQPGPSNLHQPPYGYGIPQYMAPYPLPHIPPAQMYPQHSHMASYPHYGYQQPMYQPHPVHPPQGYPPMQYIPHMPAPHPHYQSPTLGGPYQHPVSPWSPTPPSIPPNDPGMSTPPVYATPYAPAPMHHGGQTLYQSSQSFGPRNIPSSPSGSNFRHLASPRNNQSQLRSPSLTYARVPEQTHLGSVSGSPSGRQMNQLVPLPTTAPDQRNEVAPVVESPKAEPPAIAVEPVPIGIVSSPPQPPPQPPPPPAEEAKIEAEENEDDALRFSGGRIPTPNAESLITFAAPSSVPSSSPPPVEPTTEDHVHSEPPDPPSRPSAPLPPPMFTSAPVFDHASKDGGSGKNLVAALPSSSTPGSQAQDAPVAQFSIAKNRPMVGDAPALSFSRRAKMPASIIAAAVPLPSPSKPASKRFVATAPALDAPAPSAEPSVAPLAAIAKEADQVNVAKAGPQAQNADAAKPPAASTAAPPEPMPSANQPTPQTSVPSANETASTPAPAPAPPVKQPPKSWAALLRPSSPAKSAKSTQSSTQKLANGAPAKPAPEAKLKVNGHVNGMADPLPTNVPLHVILGEGATPYSAHSQVTQPRGLINIGNMCFANVVLQALVYSAPFVRLFETLAQLVPGSLSGKTALYEATIMFLREFPAQSENPALVAKPMPHSGTSTPIPPEQTRQQTWNENPFFPEFLYEAMKHNKRFDSMQRGHQEDAEEFLGFFLDTLHEELLNMLSKVQMDPTPAGAAWTNGPGIAPQAGDNAREVQRPVSPDSRDDDSGWLEVGKKNRAAVTRTTRATESAITRIFGGKLRSVLQTPGSNDSVTLEPYQPLQLDIQSDNIRTIEDALKHITLPEIVSVHSESRGRQVDARKQVTLETLPPLLILHLKRLVYDNQGIHKNSKVVGYSTTLEIRPDIISPTRRTNKSIKYQLYGVIYHHGKHATGGHYTIDALRQDHSEWVRIDDTHIEPITEKDVTAHEKHAKSDKTAYLLFYRREPDNPK